MVSFYTVWYPKILCLLATGSGTSLFEAANAIDLAGGRKASGFIGHRRPNRRNAENIEPCATAVYLQNFTTASSLYYSLQLDNRIFLSAHHDGGPMQG